MQAPGKASDADLPTVAIIGASADPTKFSHESLLAHAACGYRVYPVNPRGGEIAGHKVYPTIDTVPPGELDRVSMYVPPAVGLKLVEAIAERGCREFWLNPGAESPELIARAEQLGLEPIQACSLVDCRSRGG